MHADLKPKNIMIVYHLQQPLRVKVIDFGLKLEDYEFSEAQRASHIQTRWCRGGSGCLAELWWPLQFISSKEQICIPVCTGQIGRPHDKTYPLKHKTLLALIGSKYKWPSTV